MTRQALALSLLEEAGSRGVTTAEFMDAGVGSRYSARLLELRKAGHRITSERVREGSWKYTLEVARMDRFAGCPYDWCPHHCTAYCRDRATSVESLKLFESAA